MKTQKVNLIIEASSTGFGIYGEGFPVTAYGATVAEAKQNLKRAIDEVLEFCKEENRIPDPVLNNGDLEFVFK